jgi:hypothetical protein
MSFRNDSEKSCSIDRRRTLQIEQDFSSYLVRNDIRRVALAQKLRVLNKHIHMLKLLFAVTIIIFISLSANAQIPDSTLKPSPVKTLTDVQYNALIKGEDLYDMNLVADINKYPSAEQALKYKKELDLSPSQVTALTGITTELKRKKIEMGNFMVTNETKLDVLFRAKRISESDLIYYTNRYGLYMGELRNAILKTSVAAYNLLSPGQIAKLNKLKKS